MKKPLPSNTPDFETSDEIAARKYAEMLRKQAVFWSIGTLVLILFFYVFSSILLPFLAGMAIAYFLDPVADRFERWGLSRVFATSIILALFVVLFIVAVAIIVPVLASQAGSFIERLPATIARLQELISSIDLGFLERYLGESGVASVQSSVEGVLKQSLGFMTGILQSVWQSGLALINLVGLLVVTPVVAFYMLLDWDRMVAKVDSWVPRDHVETVR
ncbi:MAG: AI-2E family transporter, partial [Notoacmeibacter sp.]